MAQRHPDTLYNAVQVPVGFRANFERAWARCNKPKATMTNKQHVLQAYMAVVIANLRGVTGDVVEAGVWRGGISCVMARASIDYLPPSTVHRRSFLIDTFEGLPEPTKEDGEKAIDLWTQVATGKRTWADAGGGTRDHRLNWGGAINEVANVMNRSGVPPDRVHYLKGKAEETLFLPSSRSQALPDPIAVLRLDTDWYMSTKVELEVLWPRLSPGGWLGIDDYYSWAGSRTATDEWLASRNWSTQAFEVGSFCNVSRSAGRNWVFKSAPYTRTMPFARPDAHWATFLIGANKLSHCSIF